MVAARDANLLDVEFRKLASTETVNLADQYSGMVTLVVNTASKCVYNFGFNDLNEEFAESGFAVLGFPSNDFAARPRRR